MKSELQTEMNVWQCAQCTKEFRYESDMRRHELSHVPQFECKRCCKKFSYLSALRRHEKTHERSASVQCNLCGGNFRDEVLLKRHVRYSHKGTYKCDKCTRTFSSEPALRTHMKTHKSESERRYRCSFGCGKSFNFSHHLKHHEMTHTNIKQHFCQECGKGFIQSHHLKTHEKTHEPKYWLSCTVSDCKKKFVDEYARKRHLATHRKTYDAASSSKLLPVQERHDGEWHLLRQNSTNLTGRNKVVECITRQEQGTLNLSAEILNPPFIDDHRDIHNNRVLNYNIFNGGENNGDKRENDMVDDDINTCKTAVGCCLVSIHSKIDENCICAQITNPTTETEKFLLKPKNKTLDDNPEDISVKPHRHDSWLAPIMIDCKKKPLIQKIQQTTHNGELRPSQQNLIAINSSGRHIIIECKLIQKQKTVKPKILNPLFIDYDHKGSRNNNYKKENDAVYGHRCENNSVAVDDSLNACKTAIRNYLASGYECCEKSNPSESEENVVVASYTKTAVVNQINRASNAKLLKINSVATIQKDYGNNDYKSLSSKCKGCECANLCSITDKIACSKGVPNIEYSHGGIVKLRDTFDFDFQASTKEEEMIKDPSVEINSEISNCESSIFKSCKDVIGNCIVSGNSTMGEGCLCAKMMVDDQAMPEEIDEITPCPQSTL